MTFEKLNLIPPLNQAIMELGLTSPTEIQEKAIPLLLKHSDDFVGMAQTGTGKTLAFLLPLLSRINLNAQGPQALILAPTRELAQQTYAEFNKIAKYMNIKGTIVYGGSSYTEQIRKLKKENIQLVVGTPGRIIDLMDQGYLKLSNCEQLVIDEADDMLNMGFIDDVQTIIDELSPEKRIWMFSATLPDRIHDLVQNKFQNPKFVSVHKNVATSENIFQYFCYLNRKDHSKAIKLISLSEEDPYGIIFCETKHETMKVAEELTGFGVSVLPLNGDLSQSQREQTMAKFKNKKVRFLVCTDIASRGIDISHATHVINLGLPRQNEQYIHRIGRVGRAGRTGTAISFLHPNERFRFSSLEKQIGKKISHFEFSSPDQLKQKIISAQVETMQTIKEAILKKGKEFTVDSSFSHFQDYFENLNKDQVLQVLFLQLFKKEFKQLEERLSLDAIAATPAKKKFSSAAPRSEGSRSGSRSVGRSGGRFRRDRKR